MILRVVLILWDERSWELLVLSSHFIVNFLNHVPQLECESIASQDAGCDGLAVTGTLLPLSTRK